jgi:SEC-C motif domain protein
VKENKPMINCYCNSVKLFENCCEPYIKCDVTAPTAETLMRSRYTAYCIQAIDYLIATTHVSTRKFHSKTETQTFASQNQWVKLEIIDVSNDHVEFKAYYLDTNLTPQIHHEKSTFAKEDGNWYYVDGEWF